MLGSRRKPRQSPGTRRDKYFRINGHMARRQATVCLSHARRNALVAAGPWSQRRASVDVKELPIMCNFSYTAFPSQIMLVYCSFGLQPQFSDVLVCNCNLSVGIRLTSTARQRIA